MEQSLFLTIVLAILVMGLVVAGLGIGLLLTGRQRLRRGCGSIPKKKDKGDSSCPMCGDRKTCEEPDDERNDRKTDH